MTTTPDTLVHHPLSYPQQQIWFLDQLRPGAAIDQLLSAALRLRGPLDEAALAGALTGVAARHDVLRSRYETVGDRVVQVPGPVADVELSVTDLSGLTAAERDRRLHEIRVAELRDPIDLRRQAPWRAGLVRLGDRDTVLLITVHHIAFDGLSWIRFAEELSVLYAAGRCGEEPVLPSVPRQYHEVAPGGDGHELAGLDYWRERLAGLPPLELPTDRARPAIWEPGGDSVEVTVPAGVAQGLRRIGSTCRATPFMVHLAAYQLLLARLSGRGDIAVGVSVNTRTGAEQANVIGMFANTVVMRTTIDPADDFPGLVERVRRETLGAFGHQHVPFDRVVAAVAPARDPARNPLFQAAFQLAGRRRQSFALAGLAVETCPPIWVGSPFDLSLHLAENPDGSLTGQLVYATSLFSRTRAEQIAAAYLRLLAGIAERDTRPVGVLPIVPDDELHRFAVWNSTALERPTESLPELFLRRAAATPDAVAVRGDAGELTYAELAGRARALAGDLRRRGVTAEVPVGVALERTGDLATAVLAVLLAGGVYVPLSPEYPADRLAYMIADSGAALILTSRAVEERLPAGLPVLRMDGARPAAPEPELPAIAGDQAAYLVYTSGSTGRPKGVVVTHAGIRNRVLWSVERYRMTDADRLLHKTTIGFDAAVWEILAPLVSGGSVVMAPPEGHRDPAVMIDAVIRGGATMLQVVPSVLRLLVADARLAECTSLRVICSAGEALPAELCRRLTGILPVEVVNTYGPTECSIDATAWTWSPADRTPTVPIGSPLPNTRGYVVDRDGGLVGIGVPGELRLGGTGLARGYRGRPGLTAERFSPDPYAGIPGARWYHTGDLVRWRADGALEFLGRTDDQVKVNGVRVEPDEVRAAIEEHPEVEAATVIARRTEAGETLLTAYVVPAVPADLRDRLGDRLPAAMVPAGFVALGALPLTANGKVDRAALPDPAATDPATPAGRAPRTPLEHELTRMTAEVLGVETVGVTDNFFALGGHSMVAIRLVLRVRRALGVALSVGDFLARPTVEALAAWLDETAAPDAGDTADDPRAIRPVPRDRPLPLSPGQQRLWFLDRLTPDSAEYLIPLALRVRGPLDAPRLRRALHDVTARHEVLRTRYAERDGEPVQVIDEPGPIAFEEVDLSGRPDAESTGLDLIERAAARPFDLTREQPLRVTLIRVGHEDHLLLVLLHHIAFDAWSMGIFLRDLEAACTGQLPPAPPIQYADLAAWQHDHAGDTAGQLEHWRERLTGLTPVELITDRPRGAQRDPSGAILRVDVPDDLARKLVELAGARDATPFMLLLAAFQALLARYTASTDIAVGSPVAGRTRPETEDLVGFLTNTLVLRADLSGDPRFTALLAQVRATALDAYAHQDVPFEQLVDTLQPDRDLSRNPLFQIMFDVQHLDRFPATLGGAAIEALRAGAAVAKFDLTLTVQQRAGDRLRCVFEYATELFDAATVDRLAGHYLRLLAGVVADPDVRLSEVDLLGEQDRRLLRQGAPAPREPRCVPQLFEEQVARTPYAIAAVHGAETLTYAQLNERANAFARYLRGRGVTPETAVAVCLERGLEAVIALLGVLKSGGVYAPLDPGHPADRLATTIADADARIVVTTAELAARFTADTYEVVTHFADRSETNPRPVAGPGNLAYLIYTSGSTGRPKAVMIDHQAYAHHCRVIAEAYDITPRDRVVLLSALTFDVAMDQIAATLLAGATIVVSDPVFWPPAELPGKIARYGITIMEITPAYYREVLEYDVGELRGLKLMNVGSDVVTVADARRWHETGLPGRFLCNYGPTEATVTCLLHPVRGALPGEHPSAALPIGRPVDGTRAYVLDRDLRPLPVGVPGELCLGGIRLARGYRGRPGLTAAQFVPDPLSGEPGARLYRTGDLVRLRADGTVEFLGRIDQQVKIRGLRMELGEIEAALARHPGVQAAAVTVVELVPGDKSLAAYVVGRPGAEPSADELRAHLQALLPENMVPAWWTMLPALPLTASKKVDRKALPVPEPLGAGPKRPPRNPAERIVADIWGEVLRCETVGIDDDFFAVGGHSLLATRVLARLQQAFAVRLPLRCLFEARTVAALAAAVEAAVEADIAGLSDAEVADLMARG
ncbi:thioester reductase [Actinoplanes sp. SE50]|uniref:non-ribosomal peptide synthetase n=1 Tax=unclassified Actinoplanes TaxID=2626549 RepID=UPI00023ED461|nr:MULTISPECIES: non-ribosomal peptide synthetase [unclassified Actinoplanes]AEV85005.1 putative non-ribosomal peptide synthetase [Actinoplanes sp. SE50/110]ATO83396.1 thioester reductase [Actinoplanes sp. SE50]SLM00803.1 non-ribosomal peptide synthetase [Actinoplanes sp. SE50/110]